MNPAAVLERVSSALRGKDDKLPEVYSLLANPKGEKTVWDVWIRAAEAALSRGEPERCKIFLEAYLEQDPHNTEACLLLSNACLQLGQGQALDESVALARSALAIVASPEDRLRATVQLAISLGSRARERTRQQFERQRDRGEAIRLLSSAASTIGAASDSFTSSTSPSSPAALAAHCHYTLALLQAEQGCAAEAMAAAQAALPAAQAAKHAELTQLCLVLLATLLSPKRQYRLALSVLSAATTTTLPGSDPGPTPSSPTATSSTSAPDAPSPLWSAVAVWRLRSRLLAMQLNAAGSLTALAQCKKLLAGWVEGRVALPAGITKAQAEAAIVEIWCDLAQSLAANGQQTEALAAVDHALALRPWAAGGRHSLGVVYEALGQCEEAAAAYNDALALEPTHAPTLARLGALHARRGGRSDLAVARDLLAEALRYDPACAAAWYQLGRVAAAQEHRTEAEGHLLTAVQLASAAPALEYGQLPLAPLPLPSARM